MKYLLDTNVISELKRPQPNPQVLNWFETVNHEFLYLSVLTLGEIYKGIEKLPESQRKNKLRYWLDKELPNWFGKRLLPIHIEIALVWGSLQAQMNRPLPAIDSLLAATALHHDLCLVTRNTKDFIYPNLIVINPWEQ
jgi:toxin FitB